MSAITELQTKLGITADGSFGPKTIKAAAKYFNLSNAQAAHFFGQCSHESAGFSVFVENLNYSEQGLLKIFPKYFNAASAHDYARNPAKIANKVYANRMGNGDEASGDGWKHRGRGAIQLTGKENYTKFAASIGHPELLNNPDPVATLYAFESAKWYFDFRNIWAKCGTVDDASITAVTKMVNGGTIGLAERKALTKKYYSWLSS